MSQWLNYHHLLYFKTIAEEGQVSKAAQKLRIGQPTLSAQLKQFESIMGVQLFDRANKKLILTEQGRIALDYAKSIFQLGSEMVEAIHDRLKPTKISLHIAALDSIPKQILLRISKAALKSKQSQITISEGKLDELLRELTAHKIDLIITNFLPTAPSTKRLIHRRISEKIVSIYGAPKYKFLRKNFPKSLDNQPIILPTYDSKLRYDIDHWAKTLGIDFDIIMESQDIGVKKLLAINEIGLVAAASHTVTQQLLSGELIEIGKLENVSEELYLVTTPRKVENSLAMHLFHTFQV